MDNSTAARGIQGNLLARPGAALLEDLGRALAAAAGAFPVPAAHRRDLPYAVRDLSRLLTLERAELARSYWSAPRFLSAYLHYFLPWNLYRMAWLLPGLDLDPRPGGRILDLGSGPLTLPLALWCARPDLRGLPLTFVCADVAAKPMEIGRDILRRLAGENSPWHIVLQRAPLEKALARPGKDGERGSFDCIMAGNMLNELSPARNTSLEERLERLMEMAAGRLAPGGRLLLVEPGTRLGGKLIALARKGALIHGLSPLSPCPHDGPCPMLESPRSGPSYTGWCHFFHPAGDVPRDLADLARQARLEKDSLAVSCLLLRKPESGRDGSLFPDADRDGSPASDARRAALPDLNGRKGRSAPDNWREPSDSKQAPPPAGRKDARPAALADDLDELEALYAEIMAEDAGGPAQSKAAAHSRAAHRRADRDAVRPGAAPASRLAVRVISDMIRLPNEAEPGRYACCARGLALLLDAARVPSGAFTVVPCPEREERDPKTGALLLRRPTTRPPSSPGR